MNTLTEKLKLPDFNNCLTNLANSVLKKFGLEPTAPTLPLADKYLCGNQKNIIVMILDGFGTSIMEKHLEPDSFFRRHFVGSFDSVYPTTTVAATTSIMSGLYPNEHGWLGWDVYYPELNKNVTVFRNQEQLSEKPGAIPTKTDSNGNKIWGEDSLNEIKPAADFNPPYKYTPYKTIIQKINEAGGKAYFSMPFLPPFPKTLDAVLQRMKKLCDEPEQKYIYAYWNEPDTTMHRTGTKSTETHQMIADLEKKMEEFAAGLNDTLILITADHGHIDNRNLCILDYPEILNCLVRLPSIEPRTLNLFVKDDYKESFPTLFKKTFGDDFLLLTKEDVLREKVFGIGHDHPLLNGMLGDFVALSVAETSITNTHYVAQKMIGNHAGLTQEEITIPLIAITSSR